MVASHELDAALPRPDTFPDRSGPNRGDGQTVSLEGFGKRDEARIRALYAFLLDVQAITDAFDGAEDALTTLENLDEARIQKAFEVAQSLGSSLNASEATEEVRKALHDVRGGSLAALLAHLDLIQDGIAGPVDAERVHLLVRDHLKMMRNAIYDLDPARYAADLDDRDHGMDLLVEKWNNARYNLVNNAARFATDDAVHITADPVDDARETNLRFAVINKISDEQAEALEERFGDALGQVFEGGFTTGGHGLGLAVCADLVRHAYSMKNVGKALDEGLLGAKVVDGHYVAWFHWPARRATEA